TMLRFGSAAIGYGRVSVDSTLRANSYALTNEPAPPAPPPYRQRLVWAMVVPDTRESSCPAFIDPTPPGIAQPTDYGYRVFLLDARTCNDALLYTEGGAAPCHFAYREPPFVAVPFQQVSVSWALTSRDRHNYLGAVTAQV